MKCKDCFWWSVIAESGPDNGEAKGRCRGIGPKVTVIVVPQVGRIAGTVTPRFIEVTAWPMLPASCESCGVFRAKVLQEAE